MWNVGKSGKNLIKEPVYIHFDFDDYKPWLMSKLVENDSDGDVKQFYLYHMIPPGKSSYFFTFGGENGEAEVAVDQLSIKYPQPKVMKDITFIELVGEKQTKLEFKCTFKLPRINQVVGQKMKVLDKDFDPVPFKAVLPRLSDQYYQRPIRPRTPWSFPISIFKDYQLDTDEKIMECFEFDWSNMKLPKFTEAETAAIKEELRSAYKIM